MPPDDDPLRWWEDRQVEVTFPDGRKCRSWVLQSSSWPEPADGDQYVPRRDIGRMIVIPLPEPDELAYPKEYTAPIDAGGDHGRPRGVRLLRDDEVNGGLAGPRAEPQKRTATPTESFSKRRP